MTTPNFPKSQQTSATSSSAEARDRKAIEVAAATASHRVDPQINLAANLIRQQHIGTHEALVLLHAIMATSARLTSISRSEIEWLCLASPTK